MIDPVEAARDVEEWRTVGRELRRRAQPRDTVHVWFEGGSLAFAVHRPGREGLLEWSHADLDCGRVIQATPVMPARTVSGGLALGASTRERKRLFAWVVGQLDSAIN